MLSSENINLRALEPSDLDTLYKWENDAGIWLVSGTLVPFSKELLSQYINTAQDIYTTKQLRLVIERKQDPKALGCVDLFDFDPKNKRAGVGILIADPADRAKGYASEALDILIKYAFNLLDLHQLYCNITADNEKSILLFSSKGFKVSGIKKDWIYIKGAWLDEYTLQLIHSEAAS